MARGGGYDGLSIQEPEITVRSFIVSGEADSLDVEETRDDNGEVSPAIQRHLRGGKQTLLRPTESIDADRHGSVNLVVLVKRLGGGKGVSEPALLREIEVLFLQRWLFYGCNEMWAGRISHCRVYA